MKKGSVPSLLHSKKEPSGGSVVLEYSLFKFMQIPLINEQKEENLWVFRISIILTVFLYVSQIWN